MELIFYTKESEAMLMWCQWSFRCLGDVAADDRDFMIPSFAGSGLAGMPAAAAAADDANDISQR